MRNRDEMDGFMMLIRALSGEQNVIENMEAEGQQEAIRRTLLARRMYPSQADWESLGFTFIDIPDDSVMYQAELPEGWSIEATSHQMHSNILDANGHKRGSMFYKASFYDRNASMSLERRYNIHRRYLDEEGRTFEVYFGTETEAIFVAGKVVKPKNGTEAEIDAAYKTAEQLQQFAVAWANEHYPDWENVHAYWDDTLTKKIQGRTLK